MTDSLRHFGQYDVILLRDGVFEAPAQVLIHADGSPARQRAIEALGKPMLQVDVNCFALRSADGIILVDAGTGTAWGPKYGHARSALQEAGIAPDQIQLILLTHIHGDHALGLFDGDASYFPNAEIVVPARDFAFSPIRPFERQHLRRAAVASRWLSNSSASMGPESGNFLMAQCSPA